MGALAQPRYLSCFYFYSFAFHTFFSYDGFDRAYLDSLEIPF